MSATVHDSKASSGPVRLALIAGHDTMRHLGRTIQHMVVGLLDEPMALTVAAPASADTTNLPSPPVQIASYAKPGLWGHRVKSIEALAERFSAGRIELLHCLDETTHELTRKLSDRGGWPYLVSVQSLDGCRHLWPLGEHCRGVVAASKVLRDIIAAAGEIQPELIHLIRPGVHPIGQPDCFGHDDRSAAIIAVGDPSDHEAFDAVLASFAALRDGPHDCIFFIMGAGKSEHRLRAKARQLNLTHELTFVDHLNQGEMPEVLRAADALVSPRSRGRVETEVLEAMAAGAAVVVGGACVGDFVIDSQTVLTYDASDSDALTDRLTGYLEDPPAARRMAAAALGYLREHHSPAVMVAKLADLYRQMALRGRMLKI